MASADVVTVTVKGSPVRSLQKFIESDLTPTQREQLLSSLEPELGNRFRTPILATEAVPVALLNRLTEMAAAVKGEPVDQFARRAGREAASEAVRGIYRFFALVMTPPALLSKASQMWTSLYNAGELRVAGQSDSGATLELLRFPSELAGCSRITGWVERMAELTGVKNIRVVHTICRSRGDDHCAWKISWG